MTLTSATASSARFPKRLPSRFLFVQWVDGRVVAEFPWAASGQAAGLLQTGLKQAAL